MDIISYALSKGNTQKAVTDYLDEHLTNPTNPPIDTSLSIAGAAADAKKTGDELSDLKEGLSDISKVIGVNAVGETEYAFGTGNGYIKYSDGTITETSSAHNTEFISLNGVKSLTAYTVINNVGAAIAFYDKDKAYLQNVSIAGDNTQKTYRIDLTDSAYANVAYAIVSFFGTKSDNFPKALTDGGIASRADVNDAIEKAEEVVTPIRTSLFDWLNYGTPENCRFYDDRNVDANGNINASTNASSLVFKVEPNTTYMVYIPNKTRSIFVESAEDDFYIGTTATVLSTSEYSVYNGVSVLKITTGATTKYVMMYFYNGSYDYESNKNNIIITKDDFLPCYTPLVKKELLPSIQPIDPSDTSFFANANYFDRKKAKYFNDRFVNGSGVVAKSAATSSLVIPVEPSTTYWFYAPSMNRNYVAESTSELFKIGSTYTLIKSAANSTPFTFTTGATAKYVLIYFVSGAYDYEANVDGIVLNKNVYSGLDAVPYIPYKHLPSDLSSPLKDANVLIFGDSITDCCSLTINESDETTVYSWRNPSNRYVDGNGNTVQFSMWAKILKESEPCGEIRNYALSGASYKTMTRDSGNERQNVQYQIDVAMNDLDNPNNVFSIDNFVPNVVVFALGTNDGIPADTYESAMNATVYTGTDIDVDATISALDDTKTIASARKAFMRIKKAFPMAQIYCVLPIQRASNDTNVGTLHDNLKQMAHRYGCIIVDGAFSTGITRDFNSNNALGVYLKDGLHPNEKGQNLLARSIITTLKSHYIPFGTGYNQ